jgi:hypothetical protein
LTPLAVTLRFVGQPSGRVVQQKKKETKTKQTRRRTGFVVPVDILGANPRNRRDRS